MAVENVSGSASQEVRKSEPPKRQEAPEPRESAAVPNEPAAKVEISSRSSGESQEA